MAAPVLHALVVEDSPLLRADLAKILRRMGLEVYEAENGHAGWTMLQTLKRDSNKRPDVIFSDVNMPEMDGLQLLEKVRAHKDVGPIPFIILTSNKEELLRMAALCLDVTAFFIKPADPQQLLMQLKKNFPAKKFQESA
jgi:CheY-like chemotaxis protein